jgi:O-succinylhomoserine sulfhydrylase
MTDQQQRLAALAQAEMDTLAIRAGQRRTSEGEHSEPIFTTSSYVFDTAESAAARFGGEEEGNVYSRYTNPTVRTFEERIAAMEGGEQAVATSSGMAAILTVFMALTESGDHVVCSHSVFGTTTNLLNKYMVKFGVDVTFVSPIRVDEWTAAIKPNTKILFLETPSNPLSEIADIKALAAIARSTGALLMVDNCFCTPALQKPLELGADIIIHSATKYLDGQGRCMGGVIVGSKELMGELVTFLRTAGPTMAPFNAWVFLKGLETLRLRMDAHSSSALTLAAWLQQQQGVSHVYYAGLPTHPQHALAASQQSAFGGVLSFEVTGGQEEAFKFINATRIVSITANLGDAKTTIVHPATTTHGRLSDGQKLEAGIRPNLIRLSVGLEAVNDLKVDLQRGLSAL